MRSVSACGRRRAFLNCRAWFWTLVVGVGVQVATPAAANAPLQGSGRQGAACSFIVADAPRTAAQRRIAVIHASSGLHRDFDTNCNGIIEPSELAAYQAWIEAGLRTPKPARAPLPPRQAVNSLDQRPSGMVPPDLAVGARPFAYLGDPEEKLGCPNGWSADPIVRDSYSDLYLVPSTDCPPDASKAKGATFSYTHDRVNLNDQWLAKGVVGARFLWKGEGPNNDDPYLNLFAIAPIARFQKVSNSNARLKAQNVDVLSYGLSSEALFAQVLVPDLLIYARLRANANGNFQGDVDSFSVTGELQPVYYPLSIATAIPVGLSYVTVAPTVRAQFFHRNSNVPLPLFALHDDVFRIGPSLNVSVIPFPGDPVPLWMRNLTLTFNYDWYQDVLSRIQYIHHITSLTYNITSNIGISISYEKGNIEETGRRIDLTSIGLTFKY